MDAQTRVPLLDLDEGVVGLHRLAERILRHPERVVELGHAVERQLDHEQIELLLFEDAVDGGHALVGVVAVRWHVDLPHAVRADELADDLGEFLAEERLAARQVEVLDLAKVVGQLEDLVLRQVVPLVERGPVETVLALHVADRIDEEHEERRTREVFIDLRRQTRVPRHTIHEVHDCHRSPAPVC
jgi:hypothetical protein